METKYYSHSFDCEGDAKCATEGNWGRKKMDPLHPGKINAQKLHVDTIFVSKRRFLTDQKQRLTEYSSSK